MYMICSTGAEEESDPLEVAVKQDPTSKKSTGSFRHPTRPSARKTNVTIPSKLAEVVNMEKSQND